jgi:hypothetical protein
MLADVEKALLKNVVKILVVQWKDHTEIKYVMEMSKGVIAEKRVVARRLIAIITNVA